MMRILSIVFGEFLLQGCFEPYGRCWKQNFAGGTLAVL